MRIRRPRHPVDDAIFLHVIEGVHVGVMRPRVVFETLLDELKSGHAGFLERTRDRFG